MSLLPLNAQIGGFFDHVIEVEKYTDYAPEYLTVIDPHIIHVTHEGGEEIKYILTFEPLDWSDYYIPRCGSVIVEVNGLSTKGMTPEQFYQITDTANIFSLQMKDGLGNMVPTQIFRSYQNEEHSWLFDLYDRNKLINFSHGYFKGDQDLMMDACKTCFSIIKDDTYDFYTKTYDYLIEGDDPLTDKKILDNVYAASLIKDSIGKPDILLSVEKGQENGKAVLKLIALDAHKLKNKKLKTRPIVWQETIIDDDLSDEVSLVAKYIDMAGWASLPPLDRMWLRTRRIYQSAGIEMDGNIVINVAEGALAGFLQPWDEITKIEFIDKDFELKRSNARSWDPSKWYADENIVLKKNEITLDKLNEFLSVKPWNAYYMEHEGWQFRNRDQRVVITYKRNGKKLKNVIRPRYFIECQMDGFLNNAELKARQQ